MSKNPVLDVMSFAAIVVMFGAAIHAFGWFHGIGAGCAVWLLIPYRSE